jgi:hypothetical protein
MNRRAFISSAALGVLAWPRAVSAQQAGKMYRVGHLAASTPSAENTRLLGAFHFRSWPASWPRRRWT